MIDSIYQAQIDKNLDDQVRLPGPAPVQKLGTFANVGAGLGGLLGGPLEAAAAKMDEAAGFGQVMAAGGTMSGGGMFSLQSDEERKQSNAAHTKLMKEGVDLNSPEGDALRAQARSFMPDPKTTGAAGVILGGLTNFASQAVPAGFGGPAGLVDLAADRSIQHADDLKAAGVSDVNTRLVAGATSGVLDAASLLLPMTGPTRALAALKGAAGGVAISAGQTEAEKLILQSSGYDKLASTYDPFDPVSLALGGLVPAAFGAAFHGAHGKPGAEPTRADVTLTPAEQAHSDAVEASAWNLRELQQAVDAEKNPANKAILQTELDKLAAKHEAAGPAAARAVDPNVEGAARVQQAADAIDRSRLARDDDLRGQDEHVAAVEAASDQIGRGAPVEVSDIVGHAVEAGPIAQQAVEPVFKGRQLDVQATEAALPPVADGSVRLYRAESPTTSFADVFNADGLVGHRRPDLPGARYTSDLGVADYYRDAYNGNRDAKIHFVDVPKELAERGRIADDEFKIDLPAENANRARAARVGEVARAAQEYRAARAPDAAPIKANAAAFHEARAEAESRTAAEAAPAPRETASAKAAPASVGETTQAGPQASHLDAAVSEILRANPDQLVQLDGMDAPVRAADLLTSMREAAAEEARDASLLEVAAQCALSL